MKYYAFKIENEEGIVQDWASCLAKVKGKKAKYRKFNTKELAQAWLNNNCKLVLPEGIYFDAGTGAGEGSEYRVTDKLGNMLLGQTNSRGNIAVSGTNNFGELKAMHSALELALQKNILNVYGDSKLVIDFWSKGFIKKELPIETRTLAANTKALREKFEALGGKIEHISGDINPADLGYHK